MSKELELIAKQQLQIEDLIRLLEEARANIREIHGSIVGIGGPLNDNKLGYTKEQLKIFWYVEALAAEILNYE